MSSTVDRDSAEREAERRESLRSRPTQAQKMEVIGQLAGGVAHDFNNRLAVILGQAGFLLNEPLAEPQRKWMEAIRRAVERATEPDGQAAGIPSPSGDRTARF